MEVGPGTFVAVRMRRSEASQYNDGLYRTTLDGHAWHTKWHHTASWVQQLVLSVR
jgi:hypothetical protein